ncbi:thermonuclease family protein [Hansschlegelia plantiphila]|uniref:Thermonuclease family protein n=1 Tax=Hansschlegelia plantiphila TaxID=374655 RepID=A0A9W6MV65_9HYPH|nr:hypothetical protein [Hansschlegelia plantiphila]GLK67633.1 hypothetical protein GCM10008179_12710 [Hansschlegelia plantiphila]
MNSLPSPAWSADLRVVDGETIDVDGERIRLTSEDGPIDAPEMHRAKCPLELFRAQAARERLIAIMAPNDFTIERRGNSEGKDVGAELVREGHARPRPKLRKADRPEWCGE